MNQALQIATPTVSQPAVTTASLPVPLAHPVEREIGRILSNRWRALLIMLISCMTFGAVGGYMLWGSTYRGKGLIELRPAPQPGLNHSEITSAPMFEQFLNSQMVVLKSRPVLERAVQSESWQAAGLSTDDESIDRLSGQIEINRVASSNLISITSSARDPQTATASVAAVIDGYRSHLSAQARQGREEWLRVLHGRREEIRAEIDAIRQKMIVASGSYASDDLTQLHALCLQDLARLSTQLRQTAEALTLVQNSQRSNPMSLADAGSRDPILQQYLKERGNLEMQVQRLSYRLGDNHRWLADARASLAFVNQSIDQYLRTRQNSIDFGALLSGGPNGYLPPVASVEELQQRQQVLQRLYDMTLASSSELGRKAAEIRRLRDDAGAAQNRLQETERLIEQAQLTAHTAEQRVQVVTAGDHPVKATRGESRSALVFGGVIGVLGALAAVLSVGFLDPWVHSADDVRDIAGRAPVVGILPCLKQGIRDTARALNAARSVRRLSSWIQIWRGAGDRRIITVTSAKAGDGKTSLTASLGVSLAEANARVLLIDGDSTGKGLTARVDQLQSDDFADILCERSTGNVAIPRSLGLMDALRGEPLEKCVTATRVAGLFVLTADNTRPGEALSLQSLRRLLARARKQFDLILIDSGPLPVCPDAALMAAEADGVLLVVGHGDRRTQVRTTLGQLASIEAPVIGVIYNRAKHADTQAVSSIPRSVSGHGETQWNDEQPLRLHPTPTTPPHNPA